LGLPRPARPGKVNPLLAGVGRREWVGYRAGSIVGTEAAIGRSGPVSMARILVVDDDAELRAVIRLALEESGYGVAEAEDGVVGVQMACSHLPDLVLCDVKMKNMDGYRALAALRQNSVTASLPIILMTGGTDPSGMRQGMELGADDFLAKPFTIDQLLGAVEARLKKQQVVRAHAERKLVDLRANICLALPHELLTPLNGILGFTDILITDHARLQSEEIVTMAEAIRDSAQRLHRLINNFLIFGQIELARSGPTQALEAQMELDLQPVLERVIAARAAGCKREQDVTLALQKGRARIAEEHFEKIGDELVSNAFKFSNPGTPVKVVAARENGHYVLRISDRGRGMKPEHIAEVGAYMQFERRFYEQQGSGLGLTIAKGLVELHRGAFNISSEVGVGTTVEVRLPCSSEAA
jgi:signal transduction histidine kinase